MKVWMENKDIGDPRDQSEETKARRKAIFNRIRVPVKKPNPEQLPTSEKPDIEQNWENVEDRYKQASGYYMPALAGDGGQSPNYTGVSPDVHDCIGDPLTVSGELSLEKRKVDENERKQRRANGYASLTQLQYERLEKWSNGEFVATEVKQYKVFSEIPLQEQPNALRLAGLEWSIGASLYPGIEYYWVLQFGEMYDLNEPFRFGCKAKPGYLTKGLSLPWQADFHMCRTHWYHIYPIRYL